MQPTFTSCLGRLQKRHWLFLAGHPATCYGRQEAPHPHMLCVVCQDAVGCWAAPRAQAKENVQAGVDMEAAAGHLDQKEAQGA